jgi:DNA-binding transcriptional LysR family regulator
MNVSLRQLRAFTRVARLASFTRASQQLHITQAGLSGMIRELEGQLATRLFDRTTRSVTLTAAGRSFLPVAERVLEELQAATASLTDIAATGRRSLAVGATPLIAASLMPRACKAFAGSRPDVTVKVRDLGRDAILAQVESGELDAGFGVFFGAAAGVQRTPLVKLALMLASPGQGAAGRRPRPPGRLAWKDLAAVPLMGLPVDNPVQRLIDSQLQEIGRANEPRLEFNNFDTLLAMAEAGLGSAIVPSFALAVAGRYDVQLAWLTQPRVNLDFYQITRKGREENPALGEFSRVFVGTFKGALA